MTGVIGKVRNQAKIAAQNRFSIDLCTQPSWSPTKVNAINHQWVYPDGRNGIGDNIVFYAEDGKLLGRWDGIARVFYNSTQNENETTVEEAKSVFHPHAVRTKTGFKSQVVYGSTDYEAIEDLPIVWESETVYTDDTEGDNKKTGNDKALEAAKESINTAVETLFAKVKG